MQCVAASLCLAFVSMATVRTIGHHVRIVCAWARPAQTRGAQSAKEKGWSVYGADVDDIVGMEGMDGGPGGRRRRKSKK